MKYLIITILILFMASCAVKERCAAYSNASYNIMRKVVPNLFNKDGIEGVSAHPVKINF